MSATLNTAPRTLEASEFRTPLLQLLNDTASLINELTTEVEALRPLLAHEPTAETDYMSAVHRLAIARQAEVEANAALQRLDDGSYGRCVVCAEQIPLARLELRPHAGCCVRCS